jgi:alpha-L-fucosidase
MKSLKQCLQTLVLCAGGDGNLLFNVGPTPDGIIEKRQVDRLKEMGAWLRKYGETVYSTRGGPWKPTKTFASTRTGNTIYLHVLGGDGSLTLPNLPTKLVRSSVLTGGDVQVSQGQSGIAVSVPSRNLNEIDSIVKLEFDSSVMDIPAVSAAPKSEGQTAASNVFQQMADFEPDMAFDNDPETRWATDGGTHQAWISRNFGRAITFDGVHIDEAYGTRIQKYDFQIKDGTEWKTVFSGATIGPGFARKFPAVTSQEIRLNVQDATEGPTITQIQLDETKNAQGSNTAK